MRVDSLLSAVDRLQRLVLPDRCAGCDVVGPALCAACGAALAPVPSTRVAAGVRVTSALVYEGVVADVIVAFKNEGRTSLAPPLGRALHAAVGEALAHLPGDGIVLVPMARTRRSAVDRGYDPVRVLLARARLPATPGLRLVRRPRDQLGLDRDARFANQAGTVRASARLAGQRVLLVDDVVTTGATLAEAARAVTAAGGTVLGAATLASTPRR